MSTQHGQEPPRPMEPLLTAVTDSVATGYQALEHVIEGLRESLRLQAGAPVRTRVVRATRPAAALQPGCDAPAPATHAKGGAGHRAGLLQDLGGLVAEALGVAGTLVQDVAEAIGEQPTHGSGGEQCLPTLTLCAAPGATATTTFTVWNTGPTVLTDVELSATDLIGGGLRSADNAVSFVPPSIPQIGPGKGESVELSVGVPKDARPGLSRGVVVATPGDASAVLELTVTAAPQPIAVPPAPGRETPDLEAS
jgi:hypothetical protein